MTWKSILPDAELGWSKEMDNMVYYSLILFRNYHIKFMGKIGDEEKNSQTLQNPIIKNSNK